MARPEKNESVLTEGRGLGQVHSWSVEGIENHSPGGDLQARERSGLFGPELSRFTHLALFRLAVDLCGYQVLLAIVNKFTSPFLGR